MIPYYQNKLVTIYHGDCLDMLPGLPKVDLVLTDPPYGMIAAKWDNIVDFPYDNYPGFVVFCSMPFTAKLCNQYIELFRHHLIWDKVLPSGFQIAKYKPMRRHEDILIFGRKIYNPIMKKRNKIKINKGIQTDSESNPLKYKDGKKRIYTHNYPNTILNFSNADRTNHFHPTQKPQKLIKYLLKTYSLQPDNILDPFLGSGTTAVACMQLKRKCIGIEIEEKYCEIAAHRCELVATGKTRGKRDLKGRRTLL